MVAMSAVPRVLIACVPQTGHLTPLLPLALAMARAGAEVLVATGSDCASQLTAAGLPHRHVGTGLADWFGTLAARTRGRPGDGLPPDRVEAYFVPRLFGEVGLAATVDELATVTTEFRPDLLVHDTSCFAGPLVAARLGIRSVHHAIGPLPDPAVLQLVNDAVTPAWRDAGLAPPVAAGLERGPTVTVCPPGLDPSATGLPDLRPLRPTPLPVSGPLPLAMPHPDRPLVYLTLGTFSNTNTGLFRLLVQALSGLDVDVLVTVGRDVDPADLAPVPANAVIERFVTQAQALPHCAAVVHHGGAGTTFGVLAHGLPALVLPQSADNFRIADLLDAAGAAVVLAPEAVSAPAVADAVRVVLSSAGVRSAAERFAAGIAAMPSPEEVAARILTG